MMLELAFILVGLALFAYGTLKVRLQLRTIGAAVAAFGVVSLLLPLAFG